MLRQESERHPSWIRTAVVGLEWLWLLLPLVLLLPARLLLHDDLGYFLAWWLVLALPGWICWPLASRLFPDSGASYILAKPLGLAGSAFLLWTLSYLHILPFRRLSAVLVLIALALLLWLWRKGWQRVIPATGALPFRQAGVCELIFGGCLLFWTFARGLKPELDSLEKFMDVGFMNTLWRADYLPALDMWLAGGKINYYYFGQYLYTFAAKLAAIRPEISYNLAMATTFAMTLTLGVAVVHELLGLARRKGRPIPAAISGLGALLGGLLLAFGGNGQSFLYDQNSPGHGLLLWLSRHGLVGASDPGRTYWFADATRFIGYNPETADKTIHEFPYYSFLVADLHAHVINLAIVLLLLALLVRIIGHAGLAQIGSGLRTYQQKPEPADDRQWHREALSQVWLRFRSTAGNGPLLGVILLLGLSMMGNYWDFAIYLAITVLVLLLVNCRGYGGFGRPASLLILVLQLGIVLIPYLLISRPLAAVLGFAVAVAVNHYLTLLRGDALTLTGAQVSWVFFLAHLLTLPFSLSFEPIAKTIALAVNHTPLWQFLVLWGPHLLAGMLVAVCILAGLRRTGTLRVNRSLLADGKLRLGLTAEEAGLAADEERSRKSGRPTAGKLGGFLGQLNPADLAALVFFICGIGLLFVPEIVYVVDIYSGDYKRANTMFKFTYQAFVLLTLVWSYGMARLNGEWFSEPAPRWPAAFSQVGLKRGKPAGRRIALVGPICGVLLVLGLLVPLWYPVAATGQWLGDFTVTRYQGLNGLNLYAAKDSPQIPGAAAGELAADVAAIRWFNENVPGQPVVLEAFGESYTDYCRISAFTGLPTVLGWETHEWLWRTSKATPNAYGSVVLPRQQDIRTIYTTTDQASRDALLKQYQVAYVVIGDLERNKFSETLEDGSQHSLVQEDLLLALGTVVFQQDSLMVIKLD